MATSVTRIAFRDEGVMLSGGALAGGTVTLAYWQIVACSVQNGTDMLLTVVQRPVSLVVVTLPAAALTYKLSFDAEGDAQTTAQRVRERSGVPNRPPHVAVIINPNSGNGHAQRIFERDVRPVLDAASVTSRVFLTQRSRHATDIAKSLKPSEEAKKRVPVKSAGPNAATIALSDANDGVADIAPEHSAAERGERPQTDDESDPGFDLVVAIGGDGLILEVQNGNLDPHGPRLPLAVVPAGTDNALAATFNIMTYFTAALTIVKGVDNFVDVLAVSSINDAGDKTFETFATCCVGWGFVSDVLIDLEKHRWMGRSRTAYCGAKKILSPVSSGDATITLTKQETHGAMSPAETTSRQNTQTVQHKLGTQRYCSVTIGVHPARNMSVLPEGRMFPRGNAQDGMLDVLLIRHIPWLRFLGLVSRIGMDGTSHLSQPGVDYHKAKACLLERPGQATALGIDGELFCHGANLVEVEAVPNLQRVRQPHPTVLAADKGSETITWLRQSFAGCVLSCCGCMDRCVHPSSYTEKSQLPLHNV